MTKKGIYLKVVKANIISGHKVSIIFNDGKESVIDFKPWFESHKHECWNYLLDEAEFKKNMHIDHGDLVWGKDWDLCFSIMNYYNSDLDGDYD